MNNTHIKIYLTIFKRQHNTIFFMLYKSFISYCCFPHSIQNLFIYIFFLSIVSLIFIILFSIIIYFVFSFADTICPCDIYFYSLHIIILCSMFSFLFKQLNITVLILNVLMFHLTNLSFYLYNSEIH